MKCILGCSQSEIALGFLPKCPLIVPRLTSDLKLSSEFSRIVSPLSSDCQIRNSETVLCHVCTKCIGCVCQLYLWCIATVMTWYSPHVYNGCWVRVAFSHGGGWCLSVGKQIMTCLGVWRHFVLLLTPYAANSYDLRALESGEHCIDHLGAAAEPDNNQLQMSKEIEQQNRATEMTGGSCWLQL